MVPASFAWLLPLQVSSYDLPNSHMYSVAKILSYISVTPTGLISDYSILCLLFWNGRDRCGSIDKMSGLGVAILEIDDDLVLCNTELEECFKGQISISILMFYSRKLGCRRLIPLNYRKKDGMIIESVV